MHAALIPWLDPATIIPSMGPWALVGVCLIIFAETGLLVGFLLPGDTLLFFAGLLTHTGVIPVNIWWVALAIGFSAFLGGEVGYLIGHRLGPRVFERKDSGLFSTANVARTNAFFERFGARAVVLARFIPVVRTFAPVAAGVAHMSYRRYSLYNLVGAVIWGIGLTMLGYLLGGVPWIAEFAEKYIDLVILGAVALTLVPTVFHYVRSTRKARRVTASPAAAGTTAIGTDPASVPGTTGTTSTTSSPQGPGTTAV